MEKYLVNENQHEGAFAVGAVRNQLPLLQEVVDEIKNLGIEPTTELLMDAIFSGGQKIEAAVLGEFNEDIKRLKIKSPLMREQIGTPGAVIDDVQKAVDRAKNQYWTPQLMACVKYVIVKDDSVVLDEAGAESIREMHREYICTEQGMQLYESQKKAAEALNEFNSLLFLHSGPGELFSVWPFSTNMVSWFVGNDSGQITAKIKNYDLLTSTAGRFDFNETENNEDQ